MSNISMYEVLKVINQIAMEAKDYAPPDNKKIGLKREELFSDKKEKKIQDRRVIDGFAVNFSGNLMRVVYSSSANMDDINRDKEYFEDTVLTMIEKIVSYIKSEFKKRSNNSLALKRVQDTPFVEISANDSMVTQDIHYKGFVDYEIKIKTNEFPADYEQKFSTDQRKLIKEAKRKITKVFKEKFKD